MKYAKTGPEGSSVIESLKEVSEYIGSNRGDVDKVMEAVGRLDYLISYMVDTSTYVTLEKADGKAKKDPIRKVTKKNEPMGGHDTKRRSSFRKSDWDQSDQPDSTSGTEGDNSNENPDRGDFEKSSSWR